MVVYNSKIKKLMHLPIIMHLLKEGYDTGFKRVIYEVLGSGVINFKAMNYIPTKYFRWNIITQPSAFDNVIQKESSVSRHPFDFLVRMEFVGTFIKPFSNDRRGFVYKIDQYFYIDFDIKSIHEYNVYILVDPVSFCTLQQIDATSSNIKYRLLYEKITLMPKIGYQHKTVVYPKKNTSTIKEWKYSGYYDTDVCDYSLNFNIKKFEDCKKTAVGRIASNTVYNQFNFDECAKFVNSILPNQGGGR